MGKVDKKFCFVPKYYIQEYDGGYIWLQLTEGEVKQFGLEKEISYQVGDTYKNLSEQNDFATSVKLASMNA